MVVSTAREFFERYIAMQSSVMPEEYKLTYKEQRFLCECCVYNYEGNDLMYKARLVKHMLDIKLFKNHADTSLYKYKLGCKKWAKTGVNDFELPGVLGYRKGQKLEYNFKLSLDAQDAT